MNQLNVAVVGYGNVGRFAVQAVLAAEDMRLAGIVCLDPEKDAPGFSEAPAVKNVRELGAVDAALLCLPSRSVREAAKELLAQGIHTVDSFDIHEDIVNHRRELDHAAKGNNAVAVLSAGWDPGVDSVVRVLLKAMAEKGITVTNFGPGMSMGHTVAAKAVDGVSDALSMTIPAGAGIHRRAVYVSLKPGADIETVSKAIKSDPYFAHDDTNVIQTDNVAELLDYGHGVNISRKGVSGATHNQLFDFTMRINNPALTAQIMTACARAAAKQCPGAYTLIEIPPVDLLFGECEDIIGKLV